MDALVELPGVGRKTANVVLGHALGVPGLPVDRHVLRVANRIGIAESDDPVVVEQQLCGALPPERWTRDLRHADPARPAHLPAEAALRRLRRCATTATTSRPSWRRERRRRGTPKRVDQSRGKADAVDRNAVRAARR